MEEKILRITSLAMIITIGLLCSMGVGAEEINNNAMNFDQCIAVALSNHPQVKAGEQRAMRGVLASFVGLLIAVTLKFGLAVPWTPVSTIFAVV
jgi:hypothetical protein